MIGRNEYLEALKSWKDKDLIKLITGNGVNLHYLKQIGVKEDYIISLNF